LLTGKRIRVVELDTNEGKKRDSKEKVETSKRPAYVSVSTVTQGTATLTSTATVKTAIPLQLSTANVASNANKPLLGTSTITIIPQSSISTQNVATVGQQPQIRPVTLFQNQPFTLSRFPVIRPSQSVTLLNSQTNNTIANQLLSSGGSFQVVSQGSVLQLNPVLTAAQQPIVIAPVVTQTSLLQPVQIPVKTKSIQFVNVSKPTTSPQNQTKQVSLLKKNVKK
jgi:hypothetical protein